MQRICFLTDNEIVTIFLFNRFKFRSLKCFGLNTIQNALKFEASCMYLNVNIL